MKSNKIFSIALSVFVSFVFIFAVTFAATTISTNINTGGTLTVSDISTLTGAVTMSSTLGVTGKTTLANASSTMLTVSGNTYVATTTLTSGSRLILGTLASDPTGDTQGSIYYNSNSKVIKLYDGNNWFTVGTTTSGLTLSGQRLQLADLNYYGTFGTTTQSGLSVLTVEATSTAAIPLTLRGYTGQTANLFQVQNVGSSNLFAIDSTGKAILGNASTSQITTTGNLWVNGYATTTASNGNFATLGTLVGSSTMQVTGATTLYSTLNVSGQTTLANASTSQITTTGNLWVNGYATTTASNGNIATNGSLTLANSSTAINGIVFGFCNIANSASITASSTGYFNCTGATGVTTSHRVFVQATSSLPTNLIVVAASSTAQDTINLLIYNTGTTGLVAPGGISLNFFGIR